MPVPALAERFAVSTRTIERDIRALQEAGVPIYGEPGRRGGYAIPREYSLPPLMFTEREALAVLAGLAVMSGSPFTEDAHRARDKLLAAMSAEARTTGNGLASRIAVLAPDAAPDADVARAVREVVGDPRVVDLVYRDHRSGATTGRAVEPLGLIQVRGNWVLVGWCRLRNGVRGFRLDGIERMVATTERPPERRPDPLAADLSRWDFLVGGTDR